MAKPIIAFDCDGVLVDLLPGLCVIHERLSGIPIQPDQWQNYSQYEQSGISHQDFLSAIVDDRVLETAALNQKAVAVLDDLQAQGFAIAVITSRGFHPEAKRITHEHLSRAGLNIDHLMIVDLSVSKNDALMELQAWGEVIAYIDDYLPHLHAIAEQFEDINLFTMHQNWNQHDSRFERVYCLTEYAEKVRLAHAEKINNAIDDAFCWQRNQP